MSCVAFWQPSPREANAIRVDIRNPFPGGESSTSLYRARRFVKKGRARIASESPLAIEFVAVTHAEQCAEAHRQEMASIAAMRRMTSRGYDTVRGMFIDELPNIPVVSGDKLIRQERSSRDWSYSAAVDRQSPRPHTPDQVALIRQKIGSHVKSGNLILFNGS